ncbi:Hypothetical predicted protein, partial [Podarcis lilfordi]
LKLLCEDLKQKEENGADLLGAGLPVGSRMPHKNLPLLLESMEFFKEQECYEFLYMQATNGQRSLKCPLDYVMAIQGSAALFRTYEERALCPCEHVQDS